MLLELQERLGNKRHPLDGYLSSRQERESLKACIHLASPSTCKMGKEHQELSLPLKLHRYLVKMKITLLMLV